MVLAANVIRDFIASMVIESAVLDVVLVGVTASVVTVENVFFARPKSIVYFDGDPFVVESIDYDANTVTVTGVVLGTVTVYSMDPPIYSHGSPMKTNIEIFALKEDINKVPLVYLYEPFTDVIQATDSPFYTIPTLRLFFLDAANYQDWSTQQHYDNVITPMCKLRDLFIEKAKESSYFGDMDTQTFKGVSRVNFGVNATNQGSKSSIFNQHLSGVEITGDFPLRKCCNC